MDQTRRERPPVTIPREFRGTDFYIWAQPDPWRNPRAERFDASARNATQWLDVAEAREWQESSNAFARRRAIANNEEATGILITAPAWPTSTCGDLVILPDGSWHILGEGGKVVDAGEVETLPMPLWCQVVIWIAVALGVVLIACLGALAVTGGR